MKLIYRTSPETHETLNKAIDDLQAEVITQEQYNQIVLNCFKAEAEWKMSTVTG